MILIIDFNSDKDKKRLYEALKKVKSVPCRIEIKVERNQRSANQCRYYFGVVIKLLSEHTGFTSEEMHETLKRKFLKYNKVLPNNERVEVTQSTTDLDTKEFEDYMEDVRRFAIQELDVYIPEPNEIIEL